MVGVNTVELRKMATRGRLERVAHGVYRLLTFPRRQHDDLMLAVLWTGKRGVIGGQTALALYELCDANPRRIDLVVPATTAPGRRAVSGTASITAAWGLAKSTSSTTSRSSFPKSPSRRPLRLTSTRA